MMVSPNVTWPSPASATWFSLRTSSTVVLRTIGVSLGIFGKGHYRNSFEGKSSAAIDAVTRFQVLLNGSPFTKWNEVSTTTRQRLWSAPTCRRFGRWRPVASTSRQVATEESGDRSPHSKIAAAWWYLPHFTVGVHVLTMT